MDPHSSVARRVLAPSAVTLPNFEETLVTRPRFLPPGSLLLLRGGRGWGGVGGTNPRLPRAGTRPFGKGWAERTPPSFPSFLPLSSLPSLSLAAGGWWRGTGGAGGGRRGPSGVRWARRGGAGSGSGAPAGGSSLPAGVTAAGGGFPRRSGERRAARPRCAVLHPGAAGLLPRA